MTGIKWPPEDSDLLPTRPPGDLVSDDDRSITADSWSIKSDYGSTLDDDQRHADAAEVFSVSNFPAASEYNSDKDEVETSLLETQSYWNATHTEDLENVPDHNNTSDVWFGAEFMNILVSWTKKLCLNNCRDPNQSDNNSWKSQSSGTCKDLSSWSVLDIGTGNGVLLQELAKQGFCNLTGVDYSEEAIELARTLAVRGGLSYINFVVDDVLETKLGRSFQLVMDKGTLDAIGLHPDGPVKRMMYWDSVSNLVAPGGILVITSCNRTKDELLEEVESFYRRKLGPREDEKATSSEPAVFRYLDHIQTYPIAPSGEAEEFHVATIAFIHCF
ncbi:protein-lysine N-methyltransferase Mettl10 [Canna indica]|uniref:Protein-lysine N-methyltransferase Cni_G10733 n=1 Tax=Canna indica TaxID=4628 RepID=A0AAQ3K6D8_9LILI|nr:protein-lysine N-methyltransferase Mettl10 [Canna indica]